MTPKKLLLGLLLALGTPVVCWTQHYAPETEFHDPVQRVFVVEAARVLAWRANRPQHRIAEISYRIKTGTNQSTVWDLTWLDAKSNAVKSAKVEYPQAALKQGAEFYRQVIRQLSAAGLHPPPKNGATAIESIKSFWEGATEAGPSREATLSRGFALVDAVPSGKEPQAARLAGMLVHGALPGVAGHLSLDWLLTARAAAWLAFAEQACSNELSQLWGPVLFLAGREHAARDTWSKSLPGNSVGENHALVRAWNLWMKQPTSRDVFLFAESSTNWPLTMAMLSYDISVNGSGKLLAEVAEGLFGSPELLATMHNYAPLLAHRTGVGGGHIMNGSFPIYQRHAWLEALKSYSATQEGKRDFDYAGPLRTASEALRKLGEPDAVTDACLHGFKEVAPLLRLGYEQGSGKLAPTAVAGARDLLNYGWEATGLQMGSRYRFVNGMWGVREQARPIFQTVTREVQGLIPFFVNEEVAKAYNYRQSQQRLQNVDGFFSLVGWSRNPFASEPLSNKTAWVFAKRCWLRPSEFEWQARALWDESEVSRITELMEAFHQEAGSLAAAEVLEYLTSVRADLRAPLLRVDEVMAALAEKLPQPSQLYVNSVWKQRFENKTKLEQAKELEKLYWRNPDCTLEEWVFWTYGQAGAYKAARRFYAQARENFLDPVRTSNRIGPNAYMAGYLLGDEALRKMALEDSNSGSFKDMMMHIWDAAIRGNSRDLKKQVDELIERYESAKGAESTGRRLAGFLPLLPALADAKHASREKALNYFDKEPGWIILRWIWIEKYKLTKDEAIAFLGGRETDVFRRVLVSYLDGDPAGIAEAYQQLEKENTATGDQIFLAAYLTRKLKKESPVEDVPDLKPADASSTRSAVLARIAAKRR